MSILKSVDPGKNASGIAIFRDGMLITAHLFEGTVRELGMRMREELYWNFDLAVEVPQIYKRSHSKGDQNDLVDVALAAGAAIGSCPGAVRTYLPHDWKSQVPKKIMVERVRARLERHELECVLLPRAKDLQHNVWDAIGIGLHHLGRLKT